MGVAAFWIAVAAIWISGNWKKKHLAELRHDTVKRMKEGEQKPSYEQVKELLWPSPPPCLRAIPGLSGNRERVIEIFAFSEHS
jgi:hypothetical protein